jgi:hypothetical protein
MCLVGLMMGCSSKASPSASLDAGPLPFDAGHADERSGNQACIPGASQTCGGLGGCEGFQVCNEQGSGYGTCNCSDRDAGSRGTDAAPDAGSKPDAHPATPKGAGVIMFGGSSNVVFPSTDLADTWTWTGTMWAAESGSAPPARDSHMMASIGGRVVLFGGQNGNASIFEDTWSYTVAAGWSLIGSNSAANRVAAVMANVNGTLVLFGGSYFVGTYGDLWTFSGSTWTSMGMATPGPLEYAAGAALDDTLVVFGGTSDTEGSGTLNSIANTWVWDGASWTEPSGTAPSRRQAASMATLGTTAVMFGGTPGSLEVGAPLNDTWLWNGTTWTQASGPGPSARAAATMAAGDGGIVLFGGLDANNNVLGDTWVWDGSAWTEAAESGPPPRYSAAMAGPP